MDRPSAHRRGSRHMTGDVSLAFPRRRTRRRCQKTRGTAHGRTPGGCLTPQPHASVQAEYGGGGADWTLLAKATPLLSSIPSLGRCVMGRPCTLGRSQNKPETWKELLGPEPKIRPINFGALYVYHQLCVRLSLPFELEGEITKYNAIYPRNALTLELGLKGRPLRMPPPHQHGLHPQQLHGAVWAGRFSRRRSASPVGGGGGHPGGQWPDVGVRPAAPCAFGPMPMA